MSRKLLFDTGRMLYNFGIRVARKVDDRARERAREFKESPGTVARDVAKREVRREAGEQAKDWITGQYNDWQERREERQRRERDYHIHYEIDRLNGELLQLQAERIALVEEMSHDKVAVPDNVLDKRDKMWRVERKKWLDNRIQTLKELIQIEARRLRSPEG